MIEKLVIYQKDNVLKARFQMPGEELENERVWKGLHFSISTSPLLMITWPILLPELEPQTACALLDLVGARYPFSPHFNEFALVAPELIYKDQHDEWVFFGGSFNPWHKGHQACLDLLPGDKSCFILPDHNPQKEFRTLEPVYTTLSLISRIKFGKHHFIAPTFLVDQKTNPTVEWMEKLRISHPKLKLSLLMGFDSFKGLNTWVRSSDLLCTIDKLYVVSRLEDDLEREKVAQVIKAEAPQIAIEYLGRHDFESLSSTDIRKGPKAL